jgi:pyrroloquinoline-quinone synthase
MSGKSAFRQRVEEAIDLRHSKVHPWSEAWVSGRLSKRLIGEWVKQHFHYVGHFPEWVAQIYAGCPAEDVRVFLAENIAEEDGLLAEGGYPPRKHTELLLDVAEAAGFPRDEIRHAQRNGELNPETLGLQGWCFQQAHRPFVVAIAGLLVGLESQVPAIYRKTTPPLTEQYGFTDGEITFFKLHIVADEEHGERGFQILEEHARTPELREECVRAINEATHMRRLYLDGLYRTFLAPPSS